MVYKAPLVLGVVGAVLHVRTERRKHLNVAPYARQHRSGVGLILIILHPTTAGVDSPAMFSHRPTVCEGVLLWQRRAGRHLRALRAADGQRVRHGVHRDTDGDVRGKTRDECLLLRLVTSAQPANGEMK